MVANIDDTTRQMGPSHPLFPLSCQEAALTYAHEGIPVFPVCGKIPYPRTRGFHDATTDPDVIGWWWRRWPAANVAVPTGTASGWIALDIDGRHDGFASLTRLKTMQDHHPENGPALPATRLARTGSGIHMIFQPPSTMLRNTVEYAGLPGIDMRGEGGYIVVAPSLHPCGRRYRWLSLMTPAPFPALLLDVRSQQKQIHRHPGTHTQQHRPNATAYEQPDYWLAKAVASASVGRRHSSALWLACRLIEQAHLSSQQAEGYMRRYVEQVPGGGDEYPLSDALNCLHWATTHV